MACLLAMSLNKVAGMVDVEHHNVEPKKRMIGFVQYGLPLKLGQNKWNAFPCNSMFTQITQNLKGLQRTQKRPATLETTSTTQSERHTH